MPWSTTRKQGTHPKYRTREHRTERKRLEREMRVRGYLWCAQPECVMDSRIIKPGERWHVGHDDTGTQYIGPVHADCNVRDGARRGNARSRGKDKPRRWLI